MISDNTNTVYIVGYDRSEEQRVEYNAPNAKEDYMTLIKYKNGNN